MPPFFVHQVDVDAVQKRVVLVAVVAFKIDLVEGEHDVAVDVDFASSIEDFEAVGVFSHWVGLGRTTCSAHHFEQGWGFGMAYYRQRNTNCRCPTRGRKSCRRRAAMVELPRIPR